MRICIDSSALIVGLQGIDPDALEILVSIEIFPWKKLSDFIDDVLDKIEGRVELIINDRLNTLQESIECTISFYNDFLDKQNRYRQETPQQQQAEKTWIDWQRQQLQRSLASLEITPINIS
jgi:hypothetical protein